MPGYRYINKTMYTLLIWVVFGTLYIMPTLVSGHDTEPKCSRFHYDVQLLEKMIRTEHNSNLMMEEFRALRAQVSSDLEKVKKEQLNVKTVLQEEKERMRTTMAAEVDKNRQVLDELKGILITVKHLYLVVI
ncbi:MAG: hypothetical protein AB2693_33975 [Candidatus Thiodiazotropha sp.]